MGNNPQLSINFSGSAGSAENYWLRVDQVESSPAAVSLADAARLIDAYYGISPCDTGTGGTGGAAAGDTPSEEEFYQIAAAAIDLGAFCAGNQYWDAQVDVLRSHSQPDYVLHNQPATIIKKEVIRTHRVEQVQLDNANSVDLSWPCERVLVVRGAEFFALHGSTVNFARPVSGLVTIIYESVWDRLTLRVSILDTNGSMMWTNGETEPAAVVAFWRNLVSACTIRQPETDEMYGAGNMDDLVRRRLCDPAGSSSGQDESGECWQTVQHYRLCQCSGREAPGSWKTTESATCSEEQKPGTNVGTRRHLAGYVYCAGEEDDVHDPDYYERVCCKPAPRELPICRETRAVWDGNAGIAGGADYYKQLYGDNVRLVAIKPEENCGEKVWQWETPNKNCCDDITPLSPDPDNPEAFHAGEAHWIGVLDGKPGDLIWTAHGGLYFFQGGHKVYEVVTPARKILVYAEREGVCPEPSVDVDDGCSPISMRFEGGGRQELELPYEDDFIVYPEQEFALNARGGVPPMRWQVGGGITLLSWDQYEGRSATFKADKDFCGTTNISIIDVCGDEAEVSVRSTQGHWELVPNFDPCSSPFGGKAPNVQAQSGGSVYRAEARGYRGDIVIVRGSKNFNIGGQQGWPHLGGCSEVPLLAASPCGYTGQQMVTVENITPPPCTPQNTTSGVIHYETTCHGMCMNEYVYTKFASGTGYETKNTWTVHVHYVSQLWEWVCP